MTLLPGLGRARLRVGDQTLEGPDLLAAATAVAERVLTAGVRRVAVLANPDLASVVAVLGALRAGVPIVLVSPHSGSSELAQVLADGAPDAWLGTAPDGAGTDAANSLPRIPVSLHSRSWHDLPEPNPGSAALILSTSGTTGPPKGVVVSRRAIAACLDALAQAWGWTDTDTVAHGLPLFHLHGLVLGTLGPLRLGGACVHTVRPTPQAYAQAEGTMFFGVPTVWSRIVAEPEHARALGPARLLVSGSAALPVPVGEALGRLVGQIPVERYGMSETLITLSTRADGERRLGSVGLPLDGVQTRLASETGDLAPHDGATVGLLLVRAPWLFSEYLGKPEATAASFTEDGWFTTGDLATIGPDGFHRIVGRESVDLIKSGGYRIGAGEVEAALLAHPAVTEAAVVGVADEDLGQRVVAWVVAEGAGERELIDFVAASLSTHKRPREIRFTDALPRNPMGKVLKTVLTRDAPA